MNILSLCCKFANTVREEYQLEELEDLLHRFRRCSATTEMMDSTVHAIVRQFLRFNRTDTLLRMLDDRVNYGLFPDSFAFNLLMNRFLVDKNYLGNENWNLKSGFFPRFFIVNI
jgi:small subunit ribosomal protein S27